MRYREEHTINRELLEKISAVNDIINSFDPGEPPHSFKIGYDRNSVKQTKNVGYGMAGLGVLLILRSLRPSASTRTVSIVIGAVAVVMAVVYIIYASKMSSTVLAEINGDKLTVKGRTYDRSEISEIDGGAINNLKVMCFGKKVLNINKSCDGCGDLVRWAKKNNIPINDRNTSDMQSIQKRNTVIVAAAMIVCFIVAFLMVFLKRM